MYTYTTATEDDRADIEDVLLKYYLHDETLNVAAGITEDDYTPVMFDVIDRCLKEPLSFVARHSETGEIAGVILNSIWERNDSDEAYYNTSTRSDDIAAAHDQITNELHNSFWKLVDKDVHRVLHQEMSIVARPHRRHGIASEMVKMSIDNKFIQKHELHGVVVEASSIANQTLLSKHGFEVLNSLQYEDYVNTDGDRLLKPKDGSRAIELLFKYLKQYWSTRKIS